MYRHSSGLSLLPPPPIFLIFILCLPVDLDRKNLPILLVNCIAVMALASNYVLL